MGYLNEKDVYDLFENGTAHLHEVDIDVLPRANVKEVNHGYWTGRLLIDDAHAEGFTPWMTEKEKARIREDDVHVTHCSVCGGMFDDRQTRNWKGCPYCLSVMDLKRPSDARYRDWESRRKSQNE